MDTQIIKRQEDFLDRYAALRVTDQQTLARANAAASLGKQVIKEIKAYYKDRKDEAMVVVDRVRADEKRDLGKVEPIVSRLDEEVKAYVVAETHKRLKAEEERRQLEAEAMRKSQEAEDRARREQEEAERLAREAEARAENEHNAAARKKAEEESARIRRDAELQKREAERKSQAEQDRILAEASAKESAMAPIPRAPVMVEQVMRDNWKAEVYDLRLLLAEIVAGRVALDDLNPCVAPVMGYWNNLASRHKDAVKIPGVRFFNDPIVMKVGKRGA